MQRWSKRHSRQWPNCVGTGASSLTAMRDLPVDLIKIDHSFVSGLGTDPADESIVAAIMTFAINIAPMMV